MRGARAKIKFWKEFQPDKRFCSKAHRSTSRETSLCDRISTARPGLYEANYLQFSANVIQAMELDERAADSALSYCPGQLSSPQIGSGGVAAQRVCFVQQTYHSLRPVRFDYFRVLGLGSAKDGVEHWWLERASAMALVPLT